VARWQGGKVARWHRSCGGPESVCGEGGVVLLGCVRRATAQRSPLGSEPSARAGRLCSQGCWCAVCGVLFCGELFWVGGAAGVRWGWQVKGPLERGRVPGGRARIFVRGGGKVLSRRCGGPETPRPTRGKGQSSQRAPSGAPAAPAMSPCRHLAGCGGQAVFSVSRASAERRGARASSERQPSESSAGCSRRRDGQRQQRPRMRRRHGRRPARRPTGGSSAVGEIERSTSGGDAPRTPAAAPRTQRRRGSDRRAAQREAAAPAAKSSAARREVTRRAHQQRRRARSAAAAPTGATPNGGQQRRRRNRAQRVGK
jgi:hypothetical protein